MLIREPQRGRIDSRLDNEFDALMRSVFNSTPGMAHTPKAELRVEGEDLLYILEVAGLSTSDLKISLEDGQLVVSGERHLPDGDETRHVVKSEFTYGRFVRKLTIPQHVSSENITASTTDGLLSIRVKAGAVKPAVEIPIEGTTVRHVASGS